VVQVEAITVVTGCFIYNNFMKLLWDRENYVMCGSRNDRMGIAWFRAGIWKLRGVWNGLEIGRCPL
jgi:hypothetical protein